MVPTQSAPPTYNKPHHPCFLPTTIEGVGIGWDWRVCPLWTAYLPTLPNLALSFS